MISSILFFLSPFSLSKAEKRKRWERTSILLIFHKSFLFYFQFQFYFLLFCVLSWRFGFPSTFASFLSPRRSVKKTFGNFLPLRLISRAKRPPSRLIVSTHSISNLLSGHRGRISFQKPHIHKKTAETFFFGSACRLRILERLHVMQIHIASTF